MKFRYGVTWFTDAIAGIYDPLVRITGGKKHKEFRETVIRLIELRGDEKVLDLGCGTGILTFMLAKRMNAGSVYGIDISENLINRARKKAEKSGYHIDFWVGTAIDLPYQDSEFDIVFTNIMFHQLDLGEKFRAVKEIYRILKPGGKFVSAEFGPQAKNRFERRMAKGEWTLYPSHLKESGFEIVFEELKGMMWGKKVYFRIARKGLGER